MHAAENSPAIGPSRGQSGTSLIEVLVALLVLSLGALSVVGLQAVSKRNGLEARQAMLASTYANDLIERIRSNNTQVAKQAYLAGAANGIGSGRQGSQPAPNCSSSANSCTAAELAAYDLWEWERLVDGALETVVSGGAVTTTGGLAFATACLTADPPGGVPAEYSLVIAWRGAAELPDDATVSCGRGAVLGGDFAYGQNNEYRRTYELGTYIQ